MAKYRWWITISALLAALVSYGIGFSIGVGCFLLVGAVFELCYWVSVFKLIDKPVDGG